MTTEPDYTRAAADAVTAAVEHEHDFAGWLADALARVAARVGSSAALTAGRPGSWEAALVDQLVKGTVGDDEHLDRTAAMTAEHDHARPDTDDMLASLDVARAVLLGDDAAAHAAAATGTCPACTTIAATSFGITLASTLLGETFLTDRTRRAMLAAVEAARREIDTAPN